MPKKTVTLLFFLLSVSTCVLSHGIHEITVSLYAGTDHNGETLDNGVIESVILLNWQQVSMIIEKEDSVIIKDFEELYSHKKAICKYLKENVILSAKSDVAEFVNCEVQKLDKNMFLFGKGIEIFVKYRYALDVKNLSFSTKIFSEENNHKIHVYYFKNGGMPVLEKMIAQNENLSLNVKIKGRDKQSRDLSDKGVKKTALDKITQMLTDASGKSLVFILVLVFFLGLLHTMEAGHSKLIISSYMLNHNVTVKDGITYATIFTLTHIADIIILGIILIVVDSFVDIYRKMDYLQMFSIYALLFIAIWLLIKNISTYLKLKFNVSSTHNHGHAHHDHAHHDHAHHDHDHHGHDHHGHDHHGHDHHGHDHHGHDHDDLHMSDADIAHAKAHGMAPDKSFKEQLMLGFVTGLAPCLMGWSVFMMILTTKNLWTLFPVILSFGLGIFVALSIFVVAVGKTRHLFYGRFKLIQELSPIISSLLILLLAIYLLVF